MRGDAARLQRRLDLGGRVRARPRRERGVDELALGAARHEVLAADRRAQRAPVAFVAHRDRHPRVLARAREDPVRVELAVALPAGGGHAAVRGVVEERGREEVQRGLALRHVDVLAEAGAIAVFERGEDRERVVAHADEVGVGGVRAGGRRSRASTRAAGIP